MGTVYITLAASLFEDNGLIQYLFFSLFATKKQRCFHLISFTESDLSAKYRKVGKMVLRFTSVFKMRGLQREAIQISTMRSGSNRVTLRKKGD